jgi:hypothetical protein
MFYAVFNFMPYSTVSQGISEGSGFTVTLLLINHSITHKMLKLRQPKIILIMAFEDSV